MPLAGLARALPPRIARSSTRASPLASAHCRNPTRKSGKKRTVVWSPGHAPAGRAGCAVAVGSGRLTNFYVRKPTDYQRLGILAAHDAPAGVARRGRPTPGRPVAVPLDASHIPAYARLFGMECVKC
jgi:hypothetical protein